jgi:hypothetical protein
MPHFSRSNQPRACADCLRGYADTPGAPPDDGRCPECEQAHLARIEHGAGAHALDPSGDCPDLTCRARYAALMLYYDLRAASPTGTGGLRGARAARRAFQGDGALLEALEHVTGGLHLLPGQLSEPSSGLVRDLVTLALGMTALLWEVRPTQTPADWDGATVGSPQGPRGA